MYAISSPYFLSANTSAAVLHDKPQGESFDDLYHLFIAKIARLPLDQAISPAEERRLMGLFNALNSRKRELEKNT
jgi:hypothetical protein